MGAMRDRLLMAAGLVAALLVCSSTAHAQSRTRTAAAPPAKCLKALDGSCTKPQIVEITRQRAAIIPAVRVSYFGTPQGSIGGPFIPFERLFQDNETLFGLPTYICATCATYRTK
jgi:hypothetical protein